MAAIPRSLVFSRVQYTKYTLYNSMQYTIRTASTSTVRPAGPSTTHSPHEARFTPTIPDYEFEYGRTKMRSAQHKRTPTPHVEEEFKNPFLVFLAEKYDLVKQVHPAMTVTGIVERLCDMWKHMDGVEKLPYVEFYNQGKIHHSDYKAFLSAGEMAELKHEEIKSERILINKMDALGRQLIELKGDQPSPPPSAFMLFSNEYMAKVEGTFHEKMQAAADKWEKMEESERKSYQNEVFALRDKYAKDLSDWEESTLEDGRMQQILFIEEEINTLRELEEYIFRTRVSDWFRPRE